MSSISRTPSPSLVHSDATSISVNQISLDESKEQLREVSRISQQSLPTQNQAQSSSSSSRDLTQPQPAPVRVMGMVAQLNQLAPTRSSVPFIGTQLTDAARDGDLAAYDRLKDSNISPEQRATALFEAIMQIDVMTDERKTILLDMISRPLGASQALMAEDQARSRGFSEIADAISAVLSRQLSS